MNAPNGHLDTPLMHAAYEGHIEIVKKLLDRGARPDIKSGDYDAFLIAKYRGHDCVEEYIKQYMLRKCFFNYMTSFRSDLPSGQRPLPLDKPIASHILSFDDSLVFDTIPIYADWTLRRVSLRAT